VKPRRAQPLERLVDAHPVWVDTGPENTCSANRRGVEILFDCPIHEDCLCSVPVDPPLDGGPTFEARGWKRTGGEDFATVTLAPSIKRLGGPDGCEWHGFIRNGLFETCGDSR